MAKPRKKWEPEYRFGGSPHSWCVPNRLGENQVNTIIKKPKPKRKKK